MNKFTKWVGASSVVVMAGILLHKTSVQDTKTFFIQTRQLINRLIEQVKASRQSLNRLNRSIRQINLSPLQKHINQFNENLQPSLDKINQQIKEIKKNSKN